MTDDGVIEAAEAEPSSSAGTSRREAVRRFVRGDDLRSPAFGEERLAFSYMADWLRRARALAE